MTPSGPPATRNVPPKSTLFCPRCDHQSRYDGDWRLVETPWETRYLCPECGTEITARPTFADEDVFLQPYKFWRDAWEYAWRTWEERIRAWQGFWQRTVTPC